MEEFVFPLIIIEEIKNEDIITDSAFGRKPAGNEDDDWEA